MRRQSSSYKLYASGGDYLRMISKSEANSRCEEYGDIRVICRFCLRSNENSRCLSSPRGHEMVAQLAPDNRKQNIAGPSKATITRGEMERNALQDVFRTLEASDSIASMVTAQEKVQSWPGVYDDRNTGICAGVVINPTFMEVIPENTASFA